MPDVLAEMVVAVAQEHGNPASSPNLSHAPSLRWVPSKGIPQYSKNEHGYEEPLAAMFADTGFVQV